MAGQESFDNNVPLEEQRVKLNFNVLDVISKSFVALQTMVGALDLPGISFDGGDVFDDYESDTFTVTASVASGSITVNPSFDELAYIKGARGVGITGGIAISANSSAIDTEVGIGPLPFLSADLVKNAGRSGGACRYFKDSTGESTVVPYVIRESSLEISIQIDASTVGVGDQFNFDSNYKTEA